MLRISQLQICAWAGLTNHQPYDFCLIQDHASQISRRPTNHLLLNFRWHQTDSDISSSARPVLLCAQVETSCGGFDAWSCECLYKWYFSTEKFLDCEQNMSPKFCPWWLKHQYFRIDVCFHARIAIKTNSEIEWMELDIIVDDWGAHSLNKSKGKLISPIMSPSFARS